jgi:hypothetical protein
MMVNLFNSNKVQDEGQHFVDLDVSVCDVLGTMKLTPLQVFDKLYLHRIL